MGGVTVVVRSFARDWYLGPLRRSSACITWERECVCVERESASERERERERASEREREREREAYEALFS